MSRRVRFRVETVELGTPDAVVINHPEDGGVVLVDPDCPGWRLRQFLQYLEVVASLRPDRVSSPAHLDVLPDRVTIPLQRTGGPDQDRAEMLVVPALPYPARGRAPGRSAVGY